MHLQVRKKLASLLKMFASSFSCAEMVIALVASLVAFSKGCKTYLVEKEQTWTKALLIQVVFRILDNCVSLRNILY